SESAGGSISIAVLFPAGLVPALLMSAALLFVTWFIARKRRYALQPFPGWGGVVKGVVAALPGLLLGSLTLLRIRAGILAAIWRASIAVVYAVLVTTLIYRRMTWKAFLETCAGAIGTTGLILFVIGAAASFGWLLAYLEVPSAAVHFLTGISDNK